MTGHKKYTKNKGKDNTGLVIGSPDMLNYASVFTE